MRLNDDILAQMVATIVKEADPLRIYLFGSYASGQPNDNSDVDMLVIERGAFGLDRSRRKEMTRLWRALSPFRIPKDILVYSQDEVDDCQGARNHVIARAVNEGKLLYERP